MTDVVKVVNILSFSYTGTTWINTLLGCHTRTFAIGPPDRFAQLWHSQAEALCLVHGKQCQFWTSFASEYDSSKNFFTQLAKFAEKDVIVINNPMPNGMGRELESELLEIKSLYVVRDGRAVAASYARKMKISFEEALKKWYLPAIQSCSIPKGSFIVRYENLLSNPLEVIREIGLYLGISYEEGILRYWEWPHHLISGNQGMIAMLRLHQGIAIADFESREFYEREYNRLLSTNGAMVLDNRWVAQVNDDDRELFEYHCGPHNGALGYTRDDTATGRFGLISEMRKAWKKGKMIIGWAKP